MEKSIMQAREQMDDKTLQMEEQMNTSSKTDLEQIREVFQCSQVDLKNYSPLGLAFIGDSIFDMIIRTVILERANTTSKKLHKQTIQFVNAGVQAKLIEALETAGILTQEEQAAYHRGRNAKSATSAKNASIVDYRKATGMEALIGYLYLQNNMPRVLELVKKGLELLNLEL